jgi:hypothetical protein
MNTYNLMGGKQKVNYTHMTIARQTEKAVLLECTDSEGSYLHDFNISVWLPKSVFEKNQQPETLGGINIILPHYFDVSVKRQKV